MFFILYSSVFLLFFCFSPVSVLYGLTCFFFVLVPETLALHLLCIDELRLFVERINLGFKSNLMRSLFTRIRYAVDSYVESYVDSWVEPRCKRRFECVKAVPLSRYSTGLRALFRDDQVVMQPTMITLPSFLSSSLFGLKSPFQSIPVLSYHK